jgi:hypothetical protein
MRADCTTASAASTAQSVPASLPRGTGARADIHRRPADATSDTAAIAAIADAGARATTWSATAAITAATHPTAGATARRASATPPATAATATAATVIGTAG